MARVRAVRVPIKREPSKPGVWVTAIASIFRQSSWEAMRLLEEAAVFGSVLERLLVKPAS